MKYNNVVFYFIYTDNLCNYIDQYNVCVKKTILLIVLVINSKTFYGIF